MNNYVLYAGVFLRDISLKGIPKFSAKAMASSKLTALSDSLSFLLPTSTAKNCYYGYYYDLI